MSLASIWELAIEANLGKDLVLTLPFSDSVDEVLNVDRMQLLNIIVAHLKRLADLTLFRRDPFDRLLIAQSLVEDLPIITSDRTFDAYGVQRIW